MRTGFCVIVSDGGLAFVEVDFGALAKAAGVNVETIRFYQRKGLLPEPARAYVSIRRYSQMNFPRLCFIKSAQRLGFSFEEIARLLRLVDLHKIIGAIATGA